MRAIPPPQRLTGYQLLTLDSNVDISPFSLSLKVGSRLMREAIFSQA